MATSQKHPRELFGDFLEFHRDNPEVWDSIQKTAHELIRKGRKHYSMQTIIEVIRHHTNHGYNDPDRDFKINNNYTSAYSRVWARKYPLKDTFFQQRRCFIDNLNNGEFAAHLEEFE